MKTRDIDEFGETHIRLILDPQVLVFDSEADEHWDKHGFLFKVEISNSELRWVLTKSIDGYYHWHDKGFYVKTLCMDLGDSIKKAKEFVGDNKIFVWDQTKIINPSHEHQAFERWFKDPKKHSLLDTVR